MITAGLLAAALVFTGVAPVQAQATPPGFPIDGDFDPADLGLAEGSLVDAKGAVVGDFFVLDFGGTASWFVLAEGLSPGLHAMQLREKGICQGPFTSAGAELPGIELPPLSAPADGVAVASFTTDGIDVAALAEGDGFAFTVHQRPDNRANVPARYVSATGGTGPDAQTTATGDVGDAVACAVPEVETGLKARTSMRRGKSRDLLSEARAALTARAEPATDLLRADLVDAAGAVVGQVTLADGGGDVTMLSVIAEGLEPGIHGLQLHAAGRCAAPAFESAGARLADVDLPDLAVGEDGVGYADQMVTTDDLSALLSGDGTSIIVHAEPDNHANIPVRYTATGASVPGPDATTLATGDAGAGQACGRLRAVPAVERYIEGVYSVTMGRAPSRAEVAKWTAFLKVHPRIDFTMKLAGSVQARGFTVDQAYGSVLGVEPGAAQRLNWIRQLAGGGGRELSLYASLIGSAAFYELAGESDENFVELVYLNTFGSPPSAQEQAVWVGYLARGGSRTAMAEVSLRSQESLELLVEDTYLGLLGIDPDRAQIAAWVKYLAGGGGLSTFRAFLMTSDDFAIGGSGEGLYFEL